jgi:hypothetical protein
MEHWWNGSDKGKSKYLGKNQSPAPSSTMLFTQIGLALNPDFRDETHFNF